MKGHTSVGGHQNLRLFYNDRQQLESRPFVHFYTYLRLLAWIGFKCYSNHYFKFHVYVAAFPLVVDLKNELKFDVNSKLKSDPIKNVIFDFLVKIVIFGHFSFFWEICVMHYGRNRTLKRGSCCMVILQCIFFCRNAQFPLQPCGKSQNGYREKVNNACSFVCSIVNVNIWLQDYIMYFIICIH